jgi:fructosamine-3-kinase
MRLSPALQDALNSHFNTSVMPGYASSGDINQAARIEAGSESYFVKWHPQSPPQMFTTEAQGLELLASANAIKVPQVVYVAEAEGEVPAYLVLEWLEQERPRDQQVAAEKLGEGLAALHGTHGDQHGLDHDNYIGRLPQANRQNTNWADFYAEQRILAQLEQARKVGRLPKEREDLLMQLIQKMPDLIPPDAAPSLLHGDLWGGNYSYIAGNTPVIYDPAVYYGHREIDLAMTALFGGFPQRFYKAYHAAYPLDAGYQERQALYQLYSLLVHLTLFGGGYGVQVDAVARRYL